MKRAWIEPAAERLRAQGRPADLDWLSLYYDGRNPAREQREVDEREFNGLIERLTREPDERDK
ncbi:MAG: hypothetical protein QOG06_42 [Gaiellaceae bacterium]|nr:hypothetical protein [Gaiellaceae bacterium]